MWFNFNSRFGQIGERLAVPGGEVSGSENWKLFDKLFLLMIQKRSIGEKQAPVISQAAFEAAKNCSRRGRENQK